MKLSGEENLNDKDRTKFGQSRTVGCGTVSIHQQLSVLENLLQGDIEECFVV